MVVHEFYASYVATLSLITQKDGRGTSQPQQEPTLVKGVQVDLSSVTIRQVLFRPDNVSPISTTECN